MKKIVYINKENKLCIVNPAPKKNIEILIGKLTDEEYDAFIWNKTVPKDAIKARYIEKKDIPSDRYFREAWCDEKEGSQIDINIEKAKAIHLDKLREKRKPLLEKLDIELMKSIEENDDEKKKKVVSKKQELRDFPEKLDLSSIKDPTELIKVIPNCLKE